MANNLELKLASAGSGKTYSLAKKYLWYFLTVRVGEDGKIVDDWDSVDDGAYDESLEYTRRLRNREELRDSLRHILAVTFTNKATNEMQQRIVQKLFALAYPDLEKDGRKPDYQEEFCEALEIEEAELTRVCRQAIVVLLENYSDFQVSTIDSFFQLVLRTFAYETDLNDSYGLELDSDFLSKVGLDGVFESVEQGSASRDVGFWLTILMETYRASGQGWNIFQRRNRSVYADFIRDLNRLQNEDFKEVRNSIEEYFSRRPDLQQIYKDLKYQYEDGLKPLLDAAKSKGKEVMEIVRKWQHSVVYDDKFPTCITSPLAHASKILKTRPLDNPDKSDIKFSPMQEKNFEGAAAKKMMKLDQPLFLELREKYLEMIALRKKWIEAISTPEFKHWKLYKSQLPLLGLLSATMKKRNEYLTDNNTIELSETNSLLQRIIDGTDTPFIYEKLGARLNHFLIDEFQDTSAMQWDNFRPLLEESLSRGEDNMLIGDPKQSIYRFRNADPSLISFKVEDEMKRLHSGVVYKTGDAPEDNTNWRSDAVVVKFNNSLFKELAEKIQVTLEGKRDSESAPEGVSQYNFSELYGNVEQCIPEKRLREDKGYVSIEAFEGGKNDMEPQIIERVIDRIHELLGRGYMMKDIAVLVDTNIHGTDVVNALIKHNSENPEAQIAFVSEDSLKLVSSAAVRVILSTMQSISDGVCPEIREGEEGKIKGVADWNQIKSEFRLYAKEHPDVPMAVNLDRFLNGDKPKKSINDMLGNMQVVTLPALVEGIAAQFVGDSLCRKDAPYIAAFQDIVLEYCESHPSDVASFLNWWERRADRFSIASPEGIDAVKITTIHKSKGLEFPCVLVPFASCEFAKISTQKKEWKWVKPQKITLDGEGLPPAVPVVVNSELKGTAHEAEYWKLLEMTTMDSLNTLYVAFTRAVNELYIYIKKPAKTGCNFSTMLWNHLKLDSDTEKFEIGCKYLSAQVKRSEEESELKEIGIYSSNDVPDCIKYKVEETGEIVDADDENVESVFETDPRRMGTLQHQVMQKVERTEDLSPAVRYFKRKGIIDEREACEIEEFIAERLKSAGVSRWFDGSLRVLNERSLVGEGGDIYRPDRIMVDAAGYAIVVDYKFGDVEDEIHYGRQVKRYVDSLKSTGRFPGVRGYLWYMKQNKVVFVCD